MTEELLIDLKPAEDAAADLQHLQAQVDALERVRQALPGEARRLVEGLRGSADQFEQAWQRCVRAVVAGQTEKVQARRERFLDALRARLTFLGEARRLVELACRLSAANGPPTPDDLQEQIVRLEQLKSAVFDRWQTADDLEELAVESYPLSQERLQQLARQHQPPQSWLRGGDQTVLGEHDIGAAVEFSRFHQRRNRSQGLGEMPEAWPASSLEPDLLQFGHGALPRGEPAESLRQPAQGMSCFNSATC